MTTKPLPLHRAVRAFLACLDAGHFTIDFPQTHTLQQLREALVAEERARASRQSSDLRTAA